MKSIMSAHPPSISILPRNATAPHFNSGKLFWFSKESYSRDEAFSSGYRQIQGRDNRLLVHSVPTYVDSLALVLAATTAPKSADISLLLPTSAVMLFAYWIANFVLPDLIMKDIQTDKTNEDGNDDGEYSADDERGSSQVKRMQNSGQEKRAFGSTKRIIK